MYEEYTRADIIAVAKHFMAKFTIKGARHLKVKELYDLCREKYLDVKDFLAKSHYPGTNKQRIIYQWENRAAVLHKIRSYNSKFKFRIDRKTKEEILEYVEKLNIPFERVAKELGITKSPTLVARKPVIKDRSVRSDRQYLLFDLIELPGVGTTTAAVKAAQRDTMMVAYTFQSYVNQFIALLQDKTTTDFSYAEKLMINPQYIKSTVLKYRHFRDFNATAALHKREIVKYKGLDVKVQQMFIH
jgi:hypothetical protein